MELHSIQCITDILCLLYTIFPDLKAKHVSTLPEIWKTKLASKTGNICLNLWNMYIFILYRKTFQLDSLHVDAVIAKKYIFFIPKIILNFSTTFHLCQLTVLNLWLIMKIVYAKYCTEIIIIYIPQYLHFVIKYREHSFLICLY